MDNTNFAEKQRVIFCKGRKNALVALVVPHLTPSRAGSTVGAFDSRRLP